MLIVKDFDIELSKKEGYQIRTKEGNFVRILDYNRLDDLYPIVALRMDVDKNNNPTEIVTCYTKDGKFIDKETPSYLDLVLYVESETIEGWVNISKPHNSPLERRISKLYPTEEAAKKDKEFVVGDYITTMKVSWEEERLPSNDPSKSN